MGAHKSITSIQILRAVAALLVVLFHFADYVKPLDVYNLPSFEFGRSGVDVFFLVSGFIIFVTTARGDDPVKFAKRRVFRIVPLYWTLTLITFVIMAWDPEYLNWGEANSVALLKSLFFIPYRGSKFIQPVLFVGWTLNYEMFFYALWTLALALFAFRSSARILGVAAVITLLIVTGYLLKPQSGIGQFYTNPIMFEFVAGASIAFVYTHHKEYLTAIPLLGSMLLVIAGVLLMVFWSLETRVVLGVAAFLIMVAAISLECNSRVPHNLFFENLGDASYAIYLMHPLIIAMLLGLLKSEGPFGAVAVALIGVVAVTAICAVGVAVFHFFESPINQYLRRRFINRRLSAPAITDGATS